jgi:hypothetical protein
MRTDMAPRIEELDSTSSMRDWTSAEASCERAGIRARDLSPPFRQLKRRRDFLEILAGLQTTRVEFSFGDAAAVDSWREDFRPMWPLILFRLVEITRLECFGGEEDGTERTAGGGRDD